MKRTLVPCVLACILFATGAAFAEDMAGNIQFLIGQRYLSNFWKPLDTPVVFGVNVDFAPQSSPVHVALGMSIAGDKQTISGTYFGDTGDVEDGFFEFSAGFIWLPARKSFARPYLGAGIVLMGAGTGSDFHFWGSGDSDHSFGYYGTAGIYFKVGDSFNIGLDGKIVRGTNITVFGQDGDADYEQVSLLLGFSFGK